MRYENPLHFSEAAAAIDHIADGRIALGASWADEQGRRRNLHHRCTTGHPGKQKTPG